MQPPPVPRGRPVQASRPARRWVPWAMVLPLAARASAWVWASGWAAPGLSASRAQRVAQVWAAAGRSIAPPQAPPPVQGSTILLSTCAIRWGEPARRDACPGSPQAARRESGRRQRWLSRRGNSYGWKAPARGRPGWNARRACQRGQARSIPGLRQDSVIFGISAAKCTGWSRNQSAIPSQTPVTG